MRNRMPWIIACSLLLYRSLLTLAPDEFSDEYAEPALQVFRQWCRDAYHEHGTLGVLRLWLPTFTDALHGILAEQGATLKQVLCPRLVWPVALALSCVLFPFSWLSKGWVLFGYIFNFIFATPQAYIAGHIVLFCAAGLIALLSMPALRKVRLPKRSSRCSSMLILACTKMHAICSWTCAASCWPLCWCVYGRAGVFSVRT